MTPLDYGIAAGAGLVAGGVNALAGGGTLVSFPVLQFIGLTSLDANVTNIVALTPGNASGSYAQLRDFEGQGRRLRSLGAVSAAGGFVGSVLLVVVAAKTFRAVVPFLILLGCLALLVQRPLRRRVEARREGRAGTGRGVLERLGVFACSVYGGFFGAGLGIMLLAVLGIFSSEPLSRVNALKQVLSLIVGVPAALFLSFTGHVVWTLAGVVAAASLVGGFAGGRLVRVINPDLLRALVVLYGVAVAIRYWV